MNNIEKKRNARKKKTAEVFTPLEIIKQMFLKLPYEIWIENKTFLDPSCGDGNILIEILREKINFGIKPLDALKSIYGIDLMKDNIKICRTRLLKEIYIHEIVSYEHVKCVLSNIIQEDTLKYDYSFKETKDNRKIERWLKYFNKICKIEFCYLNEIPRKSKL